VVKMGDIYVGVDHVGTFTPQTVGASGDVLLDATDVGDFTLAKSGSAYLNATVVGSYGLWSRSVVIGILNVSEYLDEVIINRRSAEGIGHAKITLLNKDGQYHGVFNAYDSYIIKIDDAILLSGYTEKIHPKSSGVDDKLVQFMELSGRDVGFDLTARMIDKLYKSQRADAIFRDMLIQTNAEITFSDYPLTPTPPSLQFEESRDIYLIEAFRKLLELIDYDGHVNEDKEWKMFPVGSVDSGVTLKAVDGATDNNIISLEKIDADALERITQVVLKGKLVDDGWSDGNAEDYTGESGNEILNDYETSKVGVGSIRVNKGTGSSVKLALSFPRYNHPYLDFTRFGSEEIGIWFRGHNDSSPFTIGDLLVQLEDTAGNVIQLRVRREISGMPDDTWHRTAVSVGMDVDISNSYQFNWWYQIVGSSFNWKIADIRLIPTNTDVSSFWLDGLTLPARMLGFASHYTTFPREIVLVKEDIETQVELDYAAANFLTHRKEILSTLKLVVVGSAGIVSGTYKFLPGYEITVNAPDDNLNNVEYRIVECETHLSKHPIVAGYDFIATIKAVPKDALIDSQRFSYVESPDKAFLRRLSERLQFLERTKIKEKDWFPPIPQPLPIDVITQSATLEWLMYFPAQTDPVHLGIDDAIWEIAESGGGTVISANAYGYPAIKLHCGSTGGSYGDLRTIRYMQAPIYMAAVIRADDNDSEMWFRMFGLGNAYARFVWDATPGVWYCQTHDGGSGSQSTPLGTGAYDPSTGFRILLAKIQSDSVEYFIDGDLVASHQIGIQYDWVRLSIYNISVGAANDLYCFGLTYQKDKVIYG